MKNTFLCLAMLTTCWGFAQEARVHPAKRAFQNAYNWRAVKPGQVTLKNVHPFRAVYKRTYRQGAGSKAGELRIDRVIILSELVGWDGKLAVLFNLIDSGEAQYDDTNGRSFAAYFDANSGEAFFEIGPVPGQGKDYLLLRKLEDKVVGTQVTTAKGESQNQIIPVTGPGFGAPFPWLMGSMALEKGDKIRFDPVYSAAMGALSPKSPYIVDGQETITGADGKSYDTWVVKSVANMTSPWLIYTYVIDKPPYLIRRKSLNKNSGEEQISMDLIEYEAFDK